MKKLKKWTIADVLIHLILLICALICLFPFVNILAVSFSSKTMAATGQVFLYPLEVTLDAYKYILGQAALWKSFGITLVRVVLGTVLSTLCTLVTAYPLAMNNDRFRGRTFCAWYLFVTTLVSGGLIPGYILIKSLGLMNSVLSLVLPCIVNVFNIIVVQNFYRQVSGAFREAAELDGAGHWRILFEIYVPLSKPVIATVVLFTVCNHWNSWFDASIYMESAKYPLATYLQNVIVSGNASSSGVSYEAMMAVSNKTVRAAQIIVSTVPIILAYPFLQRYFVAGLTVGGVKE